MLRPKKYGKPRSSVLELAEVPARSLNAVKLGLSLNSVAAFATLKSAASCVPSEPVRMVVSLTVAGGQ